MPRHPSKPRRRVPRRPWVSTAALGVLLALWALSGWTALTLTGWDLALASRVSDGERVYAFAIDQGQVRGAVVHEPGMEGWHIDPFAWGVTFGTPLPPKPRFRSGPVWRWTPTAYADPSGIVAGRFVPMWWAIAPLGAWVAWRWVKYTPIRPGACPACGYHLGDLAVCPECGQAIAREQSTV
ncbi:MAG: hypothetical protein R3B49_00330 [Phycisphaerales bacterium]